MSVQHHPVLFDERLAAARAEVLRQWRRRRSLRLGFIGLLVLLRRLLLGLLDPRRHRVVEAPPVLALLGEPDLVTILGVMSRLLAIISTGAFSPMLKRCLNLARIHVIAA